MPLKSSLSKVSPAVSQSVSSVGGGTGIPASPPSGLSSGPASLLLNLSFGGGGKGVRESGTAAFGSFNKVAMEVGTAQGVVHCSAEVLAKALFDWKGEFLTKYCDYINGTHRATNRKGKGGGEEDGGGTSYKSTFFEDIPEPRLVQRFDENNYVVLRYKKLGESVVAELLEQYMLVSRTTELGQQEYGIVFAEFDLEKCPSPAYDDRPRVSIPDYVTACEGNETGIIVIVSVFPPPA